MAWYTTAEIIIIIFPHPHLWSKMSPRAYLCLASQHQGSRVALPKKNNATREQITNRLGYNFDQSSKANMFHFPGAPPGAPCGGPRSMLYYALVCFTPLVLPAVPPQWPP